MFIVLNKVNALIYIVFYLILASYSVRSLDFWLCSAIESFCFLILSNLILSVKLNWCPLANESWPGSGGGHDRGLWRRFREGGVWIWSCQLGVQVCFCLLELLRFYVHGGGGGVDHPCLASFANICMPTECAMTWSHSLNPIIFWFNFFTTSSSYLIDGGRW